MSQSSLQSRRKALITLCHSERSRSDSDGGAERPALTKAEGNLLFACTNIAPGVGAAEGVP
jgi:hypothetical protein